MIRATLEDKARTPLASPSRCDEAYVSRGAGSTLCYSGVGAADDAFVPRQRFSRGFLIKEPHVQILAAELADCIEKRRADRPGDSEKSVSVP